MWWNSRICGCTRSRVNSMLLQTEKFVLLPRQKPASSPGIRMVLLRFVLISRHESLLPSNWKENGITDSANFSRCVQHTMRLAQQIRASGRILSVSSSLLLALPLIIIAVKERNMDFRLTSSYCWYLNITKELSWLNLDPIAWKFMQSIGVLSFHYLTRRKILEIGLSLIKSLLWRSGRQRRGSQFFLKSLRSTQSRSWL